MTARTNTRLPWALLALYLVLVSAHLTLVGIPSFIAFVAVGALILSRYPGHRFGWLLCLTGLLWQSFALVDAYNTYSYGLRGGRLPGSELALSISNWLVFPGLILIVAVIPLLFPSGHLPPGRWRVVFWAAMVGMASTTLGFLLEPIPLEISGLPAEQWINNPYGIDHWSINLLFLLGLPLTILSSIGAGISIVRRLRHARGIEQQQVKWIAYAGALIAAIFAVNTMMFIAELDLARVVWLVQVASFAAFPIAAGIAILQYRLFEVDLDRLCGALTRVVTETVQPDHISLWLRNG